MGKYKVVRMYQNSELRSHVVKRGLTLAQAQKHCQDPETSSRTCQKAENVNRTKRCGPWFDGYEEER